MHSLQMNSVFVGREAAIQKFFQVLDQTPRQVSILVINGIGGVGKTTLMLHLLSLAHQQNEVLAAKIDESQKSVIEAMKAIERDLKPHYAFKGFAEAHARHREITGQIEADPEAPTGLLSLAVRGAVAGIYRLTTGMPVDPGISELAGTSVDILTYIYQHYKSKEERDLILNPETVLSCKFVEDMNKCAEHQRRIIMFFDAYEKTREYLNAWLKKMVQGEFGQLSENVQIVVLTRENFIDEGWTFMMVNQAIRIMTLDPFSEQEAELYLEKQNIKDIRVKTAIMQRAGRLPILMAYFASIPSYTSQQAAHLLAKILLVNKTGDVEEEVFERASLPRSFNQDILAVVLEPVVIVKNGRDIRDVFDWLTRQNFIFASQDHWYYHESIRAIMIRNLKARTPIEFRRLHEQLAKYYEQMKDSSDLSRIEYFYHKLWVDPERYLAEALDAYLEVLRTDFPNSVRWIEMLQQVVTEVDETQEYYQLRRMANLLKNGYQFIERRTSYDQADDLFYASHKINVREDTSNWLTYMESRLALKRDGPEAAVILLKDLMEAPSLHGDVKYYAAIDMSECYSHLGQLAEATGFAEQALHLAQRLDNPFYMGLANYELCQHNKRRGNYWEALGYASKSQEAFERGDVYQFQIGKVLLDKANTLIYIGNFQEAAQNLQKCLKIFERTSPLAYAETQHRLGWLKRLTGDLDKALELHHDAADHLGLLGEEMLRAKTLHSMGNVLNERLEYQSALDIFNQSIDLFTNLHMHRHVALATIDRAWAVFHLKGLEEGVSSVITALGDLKEDKGGLIDGNLMAARMLIAAGRFDDARPFLDEAQRHCDSTYHNVSMHLRDAQIKLERATYFLLKGQLEDAHELIEVVEFYAQQKQLRNLEARLAVLRGVFSLRENRSDLSARFFMDAIRKAQLWNSYFLDEITRQLLGFLSNVIGENEAVGIVLSALQPMIEKETPHLVDELYQINRRLNEMIDYFDAEGHYLGTVTRAEAHKKGLWHHSFHCWIISQSYEPCLLFQRRGANKLDWPNFLDISSAGHFHAGEGIEGGIRELYEELGITTTSDRLLRIAARHVDETHLGRINREQQEIYFLPLNLPLTDYRPNYPEVSGVYLLKLQDVADLLNGRCDKVSAEGITVIPENGRLVHTETEWTINNFIPDALHYLRFIIKLAEGFVQKGYPDMLSAQTEKIFMQPDGSRWIIWELT